MAQQVSLFGKRTLVFMALVGFVLALVLGGVAPAGAEGPGPLAYLPISNGFRTEVLDTHDNVIVGSFPMRAGLYFGTALSNDGTRLYITNDYENSLVVIDTATYDEVATIYLPDHGYVSGCEPREVILNHANTMAYVNCLDANSVEMIDTETNQIVHSLGIGFPTGLGISPDDQILYVGSFYNNTLRIVDLTSETYDQRILGVRQPYALAVSPLGNRIYMTHLPYEDISVIDPSPTVSHPNGEVIDSITMLAPSSITFYQDGSLMYVGNSPDGYNENGVVEVIDTDTNEIIDEIEVQRSPAALTMDSTYRCLYVQNRGDATLSEIDLNTNTTANTATISGGASAEGTYLSPTAAPQTFQFNHASYDVNDNAGSVTITVTRGCHSFGAASVDYETSDDSATAGSEYQTTAGTLEFADGELTKTITVNILDDNQYHGDTQFYVALSNPSGADLGVPGNANVYIRETTPNADLRLNVDASDSQADTGDQITYCFNVSNDGPTDASNVTLAAEIPTGATFDSYEFTYCGGGGGGESRVLPHGRVPGNAFPTLDPTCNTPAQGQGGTVACDLGSMDNYSSVSLQIVLNMTATFGTVTFGGEVSSVTYDPYDYNNEDSRDVSIRSDVYVSADGNCSGQPCYQDLQDGMDHTQYGKTLYVSGGAYAGSLAVYNYVNITLSGNVTIQGSLQLYDGNFVSTPQTLTVKGNLYTNSNSFDPNNGTVVLQGEGTQYLYSNLSFYNLTIQNGTTVEAGYYQITVNGTFINHGILRGYSYNYFYPDEPLLFNAPTGNPGVQLTSTGENLPDSASVTIGNGEAPTTCGSDPFPALAVQRSFEISPYSGNPIELTVRFYFDDAEVGTIDPETLKVYHCNGTEWELLGGTYGVDENGRKYVEITGVSSFSPFGLGGNAPVAPTSATLVAVKAKAHKKGGVQVKWETGSEANVLGFDLWRSSKQNGEFEKISNGTMPAKSTGEIKGNKYSKRDKKAKAGRVYFYKLQVLYADGTSEWSNVLKVKLP